jgi:plasmid stabilization system protein ParE
MSYRVVFLDEATQDIDDITEYLSQFYANTARKFFDKMKKHVGNLEIMPYMYPVYEDDSFFHRVVIDDYLLFYSVDEKQSLVTVHRIFHSKMDIRHIFEHRTLE